jgi:hypothetical protein
MSSLLFRGEQVFDSKKFALPHHGQDALMSIGSGKPGQLVAWLKGYPDAGRPAEFDQSFKAIVSTLASDGNMVKLA